MSDDKFITVPVRVPADLEVVHESPTVRWMHLPGDKFIALFYCNPQDQHWVAQVGQQIAAAIEARKPQPPKFGPGDIVEWVDSVGTQRVGIIKEPAEPLVYWLTDGITRVHEDCLKLVRRAEK